MKTDVTPVPVLLVEDNPADQELIRRALQRVDARVNLHIAKDAAEAWDRLQSQPPGSVGLVFLDLNLPVLSGHDFLARLRQDEAFRHLPVIVLTTSTAPEEVRECYRLGCNSFLTKPAGFCEYVQLVTHLCHFWLETATLPR